MFALFHQNFSQFFYAFAVGLILAYIYCRSGKIWIPMLLHGFYDFCASMKEPIWTIIFLVFIVALDVAAYKKVNEMERQDRPL